MRALRPTLAAAALLGAVGDAAAQPATSGPAAVAFRLPDSLFIPEGIARDPRDGAFLVGSTFRGSIARVEPGGGVRTLLAPGAEGVYGIVGLRVDAPRGLLWAATSHAGAGMPTAGTRPEDEGRSSLVAVDARTGAVRHRHVTPRGERHFYNDVAVARDGRVYLTDTQAGALLTLAPGAGAPERLLPDSLPAGPNGIDLTADETALVVALGDRIGVVDLASRRLRLVAPHPLVRTTLIDGLYAVPGGVLAVEPFDRPGAVVKRYWLDAAMTRVDSVRLVADVHPLFEQPTTAAVAGDTAFVIANSHLQTFRRNHARGGAAAAADSVRPPAVLRARLDGPLAPARVRELGVVPLTRADAVAIVDPVAMLPLAVVPTRGNPMDAVASSDGRTAYVLETGLLSGAPGTTVAVLDVRERRVRDRIDLAPYRNPHWAVASADGRTLWVAAAPDSAVVEVDLATKGVRHVWRTGAPGSWTFAVHPGGAKLYAANFDAGTLSVVHRDGRPPRLVPLGRRPVAIDVTPDGRELWVGSADSDTLHVLDTAGDSIVAALPVPGGGPVRLAFTPDGTLAVVALARANAVAVVDVRARRELGRVATAGAPKGVYVRGDGRIAYVSLVDARQLVAIDLRGRQVVRALPLDGAPERMAFFPAAALTP
jgi:YVTN family beta-propeller protein